MYQNIDKYIERLITESTPDLPIWNIESIRQGKKPHWNYIDGCMITSLLALCEITGEKKYFDFAESFIDYYVADDGSILGYDVEKYNLDDLNEGRVLFELYRKTGKEKYRTAIENQKKQLDGQPRTCTNNFWHKLIYPNQIWLDGIYMAQVFSTLYAKEYGGRDYSDMLCQIENVNRYMRDEKSGLYYHGLDCSKSIFWADKESGLYWQVVDQPGREGNYLETSGSSMIAYAFIKGARLGVLSPEYRTFGKETFDGICQRYLKTNEQGELNLGGICLVAGLGPDNNRRRDGSYEYYISEPVVENDAKGVAPFLLCYTEILRMKG